MDILVGTRMQMYAVAIASKAMRGLLKHSTVHCFLTVKQWRASLFFTSVSKDTVSFHFAVFLKSQNFFFTFYEMVFKIPFSFVCTVVTSALFPLLL